MGQLVNASTLLHTHHSVCEAGTNYCLLFIYPTVRLKSSTISFELNFCIFLCLICMGYSRVFWEQTTQTVAKYSHGRVWLGLSEVNNVCKELHAVLKNHITLGLIKTSWFEYNSSYMSSLTKDELVP